MKIAIIITGMGMGGAEMQVAGLADGFSSLGHEVLIVGLVGEPEVMPKDSGVSLQMIGMHKSFFSTLNAFMEVGKILKEFSPDIVHSHMFHANIFARILRLFHPMPKLLCTAHNSNEGSFLRMLVYRMTDWLCDGSTNVSEEAVIAFRKKHAVPPGRMRCVYNGIDTEYFFFSRDSRKKIRSDLKVAEAEIILLAVGRFFAAKDYPNLFAAFAKLQPRQHNLCLLIVGDGPLRNKLSQLAINLGIDKKVVFLGIRRDIPAMMSASDLFVLSSAWEGFGLVVAEAMSCGCPVVATDCGGVSEVLGGTNILVPPKDPGALASGIARALARSEDEKKENIIKAKKRVQEKFSLSQKTLQWLELYSKTEF